MSKQPVEILIVAGEASGDAHAAKLVRAMRELRPGADANFFGAAGPKMADAGVEAVVRSDSMAIVGLLEIGKALPMFYGVFRKLRREAKRRNAKIAILVDFPDFNMKLAKSLKKQGVTVVYYISPQLWAWRQYRIRTIRKYVDLLLSILPFEEAWYAERGITHVRYVGNPLAREVHAETPKDEFCSRHGLDPEKPIVALLPGSRGAEIGRILPELGATAELMRSERGDLQFVAALPHGKLERARTLAGDRSNVVWAEGETYDALNASDAAAITSGTATLEAGIIGTPMAIVYKTSGINYKLLRPLIDVEHFGLINLIAGERVAEELIQGDLTPRTLADELFRLLEPSVNAAVRGKLAAAAEKLGHGGASARAAAAIFELMDAGSAK